MLSNQFVKQRRKACRNKKQENLSKFKYLGRLKRSLEAFLLKYMSPKMIVYKI